MRFYAYTDWRKLSWCVEDVGFLFFFFFEFSCTFPIYNGENPRKKKKLSFKYEYLRAKLSIVKMILFFFSLSLSSNTVGFKNVSPDTSVIRHFQTYPKNIYSSVGLIFFKTRTFNEIRSHPCAVSAQPTQN